MTLYMERAYFICSSTVQIVNNCPLEVSSPVLPQDQHFAHPDGERWYVEVGGEAHLSTCVWEGF